MIETIEYKGQKYPKFQASGHASRFVIPFAQEVCKGIGFDIGCGKEEWAFPNSIMISPNIITHLEQPLISRYYSANDLPNMKVDYIFSSHCLEHVDKWMMTLDYWIKFHIKSGGVLFLYLPDYTQGYWTFGNSKHVNVFSNVLIRKFMEDRGLVNIFVSDVDLNNSFAAMAEIP